MCNNTECANYFKSQRAYHRCLEELRKKWKSYGRAAGRITIRHASPEERRAVEGIIGRVFYEDAMRFSFQEFEQGLQRTRFAPVDMRAMLEEYFGEPMITTQGRQKEKEERRGRFFEECRRYFEEKDGKESAALLWLERAISEKKHGYRLLMKEYERDEGQAGLLVRSAGNALMRVRELQAKGDECPLAVLAAEITGNPHYFDRGTAAGDIFVCAVCCCENRELPGDAHRWRQLLMQIGIVPDNISSQVHGYGLRLLTKEGRHAAFDAFCDRKEPYVITMENMKGIIGVQTAGGRVYIVENEMVFGYLVRQLKNLECTLLCTSGQPRAVVHVLLPLLQAAGAVIYYNGDIDPDGICIADRLWEKYEDCIRIWRMSPEDYMKSLSREDIGEPGVAKLEGIRHPVLKETAKCMKEKRLAGYQENMLGELLKDIRVNKP